jgi:hypothetical protein
LTPSARFARLAGGGRLLGARALSSAPPPATPEPAIETAESAPRKFREVSNDVVFQLAIQGHHGATRERLVREVMRVDKCTWMEARSTVEEMNMENDRYKWFAVRSKLASLVISFGSLAI